MATVDDVDELIERYHLGLRELVNGNPEHFEEIYSHRDDVSLANPFGPLVRGWDRAARAMEGSASNYRDGEIVGFENVAKYLTSEDISPVTLRVTSIFRPEDGTWKIVHRHADPITTPQPAESVIQE